MKFRKLGEKMEKKVIIFCLFYCSISICFTIDIGKNGVQDRWFEAAETGDLNTVKRLVGQVYVNVQDKYGRTALIKAIRNSHEEVVEFLLSMPGINVNSKDLRGITAIHEAVLHGNYNIVKLLLKAPGIDVNAQNSTGDTALIYAVMWKHEKILKLLLKVPTININIQNLLGSSALLEAGWAGNKDFVKLLLDAGANYNIQNKQGKTVIDLAHKTFKPELKTLIDAAQKHNWFDAVEKDHLTTIQELIKKIDPNVQDEYGESALIKAVLNKHEDIVKFLLRAPNIDVNAQDINGFTALIIASWKGYYNIVELLLHVRDIDVNIQNKMGDTALIAAASWSHENIVKILLQVSNINLNAQDSKGSTAIMHAVLGDNIDIAKTLLQAGADPYIKNNSGLTIIDQANPRSLPILEKLIIEFNLKHNPRIFSGLSSILQALAKQALSRSI